jgi:hypothetical protein
MLEVQCHLVTTDIESARLDPLLTSIFEQVSQDNNYQLIVDELRLGINYRALPREHPGRTLSAIWSKLSLLDDEKATMIIQDSHRI